MVGNRGRCGGNGVWVEYWCFASMVVKVLRVERVKANSGVTPGK